MSFKTLTFSELSELPLNIVFIGPNQACTLLLKYDNPKAIKNVFIKKRLLNKTFFFWSHA